MASTIKNSGLKNAIVTGVSASCGIGRCLVKSFLEQGYKVVGVDINDLEVDTGHTNASLPQFQSDVFHFIKADISDEFQVRDATKEAVQWLGGKIHVLINNAAQTRVFMDGVEEKLKAFARTISVNLNGAFFMSHYVSPYMPCGSSIIHISSTRALQSEPHTEAYTASKAGLCGLTHSQAVTWAGKIRVNAVLPGWINTDPKGRQILRPEDHVWHPVGRVGVPEDIAEMCLFLADSNRAGFITGQEFVIDGGVTKKMVYPD
ncbi:hypothetical protein AMTR_s00057p00190390 [Amborella trichopoda]|uniref:Uncharacterized protein n=2 Tax=Amborella trichopoda TaxID=13333 RepID=U5D3X5_AMBTC|nr:hypothetical protein AMTR_s00057p00190390 [Amborella trichopoda]